MYIKHLKPSKSKYKQGYIDPGSCKKYVGPLPIIYRSSYEKKFILWCETCKSVVAWSSECIGIPYSINESNHTYYPDYMVKMANGEVWMVEIKPLNQTKKPASEEGWLWKEWVKNNYKWRAAMAFCESKGIQFKIITEASLQI